MIKYTNLWKDFTIIDAGDKEKLEKWGPYTLRRPDPSAIWPIDEKINWKKTDAYYTRNSKGGGQWHYNNKLPKHWTINYGPLTFKVAPTDFKHTGLFPEQALNWDFMIDKIQKAHRPIKVLNLFAYTGGATMACSYANAEVVHVDASKGMIEWAKENMHLSNLSDRKIRFIVDDCIKFVKREIRRGHKYDAIVMDPPSYGRGPNNELWKLENNLLELINICLEVLSDEPLFFLINAYTTGFSSSVLNNVLKQTIGKKYPYGYIETSEIGLPINRDDMVLPCGIYGRWYNG